MTQKEQIEQIEKEIEDRQHQLNLIAAYSEGQTIQAHMQKKWKDMLPSGLIMNFTICDYRIKPKPREYWVAEFNDGSLGFFTSKDQAEVNTHYEFIKDFKSAVKFVEVLE